MSAPRNSSRERNSLRNRKPRRPYRLQLESLESRFLLATFVVNSTADLPDVNPGNVVCETATSGGVCTLRAAIQEANAFDDGVQDFIIIPAGTYTLTITGSGEDAGATGDLDITADLTIQRAAGETMPVVIQAGTLGPNDDSVGGGNGIDRVVDVPDLGSDQRRVNVVFTDVTIQHGVANGNGGGISFNTLGLLTLTRVTVTDNEASLFGGGIFVRRGDMNVNDSFITLNHSDSDGGGIDTALSGSNAVIFLNSMIANNDADGDGGGIYNDVTGTLTLINSVVSGNNANNGGGIYNAFKTTLEDGSVVSNNMASADGGGIFNFGSLPDGGLFVTNSTISLNRAESNGGGIAAEDAHTEITSSTIDGNQSVLGDGGGIFTSVATQTPGTLIVNSSTLSNNMAGIEFFGNGGAIANVGDTVTINNTTLNNNSAGRNGGAIHTRGDGTSETLDVQNSVFFDNNAKRGGAIFNVGDTVMLSNVTISRNSGEDGGGLYQDTAASGSMLVINVTINDNTATDGSGSNIFVQSGGTGPVQLGNTIVASGNGNTNCNDGSLITSFGHNLEDANSCGFDSTPGDGDLRFTEPFLVSLQNNGGTTNTHALCEAEGVPDTSCDQGASPAIDAGDNNLSPGMTDQRGTGFARIVPTGGTIDIGAFEVQQARACSLVVTTTADTVNAADSVNSLREAINCSNGSVGVLDTITFAIPGSGTQTINVGGSGLGALPTITDAVVINGYSQTGASVNTLANGTNAVLRVELNGASAGLNANGLTISAGGSTVRGLVINRFTGNGDGILLTTPGNTIAGNFVGTNAAGTAALGNDDGITINLPPNSIGGAVGNNTIGGTNAADRNIISGNRDDGIDFGSGGFNVVQGNLIGTNAAGTGDLGNADEGLQVDTTDNTIGGTVAGARNIISGNDSNGVQLRESGNLVQGNFIGTNAAGTGAIPNSDDGVEIDGAAFNTVGGTTAAARNVISGNGFGGVFLFDFGAFSNLIQGNFIGVDVTGIVDLGNGDDGVDLDDGPFNNTIGGLAAGAGNVISGNGENGITLEGSEQSVDGNVMQGNFIGTDSSATLNLHNDSAGIDIRFAFDNLIERNTIAFNQSAASGTGIAVFSGTGNAIRANSIFSNVGLGIDLLDDGVTKNDAGDTDSGANDLANFSVLESAMVSGGNLTVTGFARPGAEIELFIVDADPTGFGEGKTFLALLVEGSAVSPVDGDATTGTYGPGLVNGLDQGTDTTERFRFTIPTPVGVAVGTMLTSTATLAVQARGSRTSKSTSEFSGNITVAGVVTQFDFGDAASSYKTLLADNGPRHALGSGLALACGGTAVAVDSDANGQPSTFADGDDLDADGFDEEGVQLSPLTSGTTGSVTICATASGKLDAFIDFNDDGDFADAGEKILNNVAITAGTDIFNFSVPASATGGSDGVTFSRFRISTSGGLSFTGSAADGEVEDHSVDIVTPPQSDFGDAPASYGNPRHELAPGPILGDDIDSEATGQPSNTATGDDGDDTPDDEDGVTFVGSILVGSTANVNVVVNFCCARGGASRSARLDAFLDFNGDGDFADMGERIFDSRLVFEGTNSLSFPVPADAGTGFTFARFRVSSFGDLSADGPASDGEVEDYRVRIRGGEGGCEDLALDVPETGEGNVKARVSGGVLRVRGDVLGNGLVLEAGDGPGSYQITGLGATTINRQFGTQQFVGVTRGIQIGLLGGPDVLVLDGSSAELAVTGKLKIRSGTGSTAILDRIFNSFGDADIVRIVDVLLESGLSVRLRRSGDDLGLCGVDSLGRVRTGEGLGSDTFTLDDGTFSDRYRTGVGRGPDVISIEQNGSPTSPSTEFNGRVKLRGRRGNDSICIGIAGEPGNSANFHDRTRIRGGRGRHDSVDGVNNGANTFDTPPQVTGIEDVDTGNPACGLFD